MIGSIILVILLIALVGFLTYLITENIPMKDMFKQVITAAACVFIVLYLLALVMGTITLPTLKQLF